MMDRIDITVPATVTLGVSLDAASRMDCVASVDSCCSIHPQVLVRAARVPAG